MRTDDARLNILVFLIATTLVFVGLVAFARYPALFTRGREYRAVFDNVTGLNRGDEVRYGGLLVGTVTDIELDPADPTRIEVRFSVRRKTPVHVDTHATITQVGLLGEPFLNLVPGQAHTPAAPAGTTLASDENLSFQDAMTRLARFMDRTDTLFATLDRFDPGTTIARLDRTLARVETLVEKTDSRTDRAFTTLEGTGKQLSDVLARTDRLLVVVDTLVRASGPGLADTQREALLTLRETRQLVADVRDGLQQEGGVDQLMRNLAVATDNLARLSTRLERDPTSVLKRRELPRKTVGPSLR